MTWGEGESFVRRTINSIFGLRGNDQTGLAPLSTAVAEKLAEQEAAHAAEAAKLQEIAEIEAAYKTFHEIHALQTEAAELKAQVQAMGLA